MSRLKASTCRKDAAGAFVFATLVRSGQRRGLAAAAELCRLCEEFPVSNQADGRTGIRY